MTIKDEQIIKDETLERPQTSVVFQKAQLPLSYEIWHYSGTGRWGNSEINIPDSALNGDLMDSDALTNAMTGKMEYNYPISTDEYNKLKLLYDTDNGAGLRVVCTTTGPMGVFETPATAITVEELFQGCLIENLLIQGNGGLD